MVAGLADETHSLSIIARQAASISQAERLYDQLTSDGKIGCPSTSHHSIGESVHHVIEVAEHAVEGALASGIAATRKFISDALGNGNTPAVGDASGDPAVASRMSALEKENKSMKGDLTELKKTVSQLTALVKSMSMASVKSPTTEQTEDKEEEEDFDMFESDEEEEDAAKEEEKKKRLEAYAAKKAKKPGVIAKSSVILDVKPWDDETDMSKIEEHVRSIVKDGLVWGAAKLMPVGYGIKKLQIICIVEDDKVSIDELTEDIEACEDYVQSVDIAAFQKI